MRVMWVGLITAACLIPASSFGQVTRVATFENLAPGFYGASFTDPASGIRFRNLTGAVEFVINANGPSSIFGGTHYLTGGAFGFGGMGTGIGFTADLPHPASSVSLDVINVGNQLDMVLQGFDATGKMVAQASHPPNNFFAMEINTPGYDIVRFRMAIGGSAYDNIRFVVPEPGGLTVALVATYSFLPRRKR